MYIYIWFKRRVDDALQQSESTRKGYSLYIPQDHFSAAAARKKGEDLRRYKRAREGLVEQNTVHCSVCVYIENNERDLAKSEKWQTTISLLSDKSVCHRSCRELAAQGWNIRVVCAYISTPRRGGCNRPRQVYLFSNCPLLSFGVCFMSVCVCEGLATFSSKIQFTRPQRIAPTANAVNKTQRTLQALF